MIYCVQKLWIFLFYQYLKIVIQRNLFSLFLNHQQNIISFIFWFFKKKDNIYSRENKLINQINFVVRPSYRCCFCFFCRCWFFLTYRLIMYVFVEGRGSSHEKWYFYDSVHRKRLIIFRILFCWRSSKKPFF